MVDKKSGDPHFGKNVCSVKHSTRYVACKGGCVYVLPLSCGEEYVGQSGRCVNVCLREHELSLKGAISSRLAAHCRSCRCHPIFCDTRVVFGHAHRVTRVIAEASHIGLRGDSCVGQVSVSLHAREIAFIGRQ